VGQPDGQEEAGYWGEIMTVAALTRGIGGLVLDGCVRDRSRLIDLGLPVFCTGLSINGTDKFSDGKGSIGDPIKIAGVAVEQGDLIYGDEDGVVVVPQGTVPAVVAAARTRKRYEREIIRRIKAGESTLEIFQLAGNAWHRSESESQADAPVAPSTSSET
jgi:4-hydroxy-4-methyl-2-oxoglutarate aldolase